MCCVLWTGMLVFHRFVYVLWCDHVIVIVTGIVPNGWLSSWSRAVTRDITRRSHYPGDSNESGHIIVQGKEIMWSTRNILLHHQVFLQHLVPLSQLDTFPILWMSLLDTMKQFMSLQQSELLVGVSLSIVWCIMIHYSWKPYQNHWKTWCSSWRPLGCLMVPTAIWYKQHGTS